MANTQQMNPAEFREFLKQQAAAEEVRGRQKFGNIWTEVDGIKFQSLKEARYYGTCKMLVLAKKIVMFERQKIFTLEINGVQLCDYIADFVLYYADGRQEVIDVKSKATAQIALYQLKKKLMAAVLGIKIIEK